jgi:hypothetical protein
MRSEADKLGRFPDQVDGAQTSDTNSNPKSIPDSVHVIMNISFCPCIHSSWQVPAESCLIRMKNSSFRRPAIDFNLDEVGNFNSYWPARTLVAIEINIFTD